MMEDTILEVENLRTSFATDAGSVQSVRGITFHVGKGESLGIVGESGCGKSVTMLSIMGLLEDNASRQANALLFDGEDLLKKSPREMRKIQGNRIGMIFQDPMTSLNPLFTVGEQIRGPLMRHQKLSRKEAEKKALVMLEAVGLPSPERRLKQYPHELSGGMRQRVMIAIAMCCKPELLIADEPTTALDVTIQAQILELMAHMKNEFNTSVILITHDLGVISSLCTRVIVMYGGLIMEEGPSLHGRTSGLHTKEDKGKAGANLRHAARPFESSKGMSLCGPVFPGHEALRRPSAALLRPGKRTCQRLLASQ